MVQAKQTTTNIEKVAYEARVSSLLPATLKPLMLADPFEAHHSKPVL